MDNYFFYQDAYQKYGVSAKGLKWSSAFNQNIRFQILINFIASCLKESNIIDVGSGYGDLISYLEKNNFKSKSYLGIDCEEFMCEISSKRFPKYNFSKIDILKDTIPSADYLICSGALNILNKDDFLFAIQRCFKASTKGFIFNFLTSGSIHKYNSDEVIKFCKTLSPKIKTSKNYLENDFSILIEK